MFDFLRHIVTSTAKETLLLRRDRAGLLVLFFMPAVLVVIITLVQENVMELSGETSVEVLYHDEDKFLVGQSIFSTLKESERISLVELNIEETSRDEAISLVNSGHYQVLVAIPQGATTRLKNNARTLFKNEVNNDGSFQGDTLPVFFDPGVLPGFRSGIVAILKVALFRVEMELKIVALEEKVMQLFPGVETPAAEIDLQLLHKELLQLRIEQVGEVIENKGSAVQHNIPAWSLFGLFFTCIPLAGALLVERNSGIWIRLMSMPVSAVSLLIGKIVAYVAVCLCQISLIVLIGFYLFPLIGLPAFSLSGNIGTLILVSVCCGLAACGYGVFLGSLCTSLEQASMFGSISIVIAAALGGVLVPVYAMPAIMQKISVFSPLNWGLSSYQDVLLRGFSLSQISGDLIKLVCFFLCMLLLSWKMNRSDNG